MPWWPFSKERRIRCSDGSYRYVFKDPRTAFPLLAREWSSKAQIAADTLSEIQAGASAEVASRIRGLLFRLDDKNASVQQKCCAAYVVYKVNPCGKDGWLEREIRTVLAEESFLRRLDAVIDQVRLATSGDLPADEVLRRIDAAMAVLSLPEAAVERREAFQRAPELARAWRTEPAP